MHVQIVSAELIAFLPNFIGKFMQIDIPQVGWNETKTPNGFHSLFKKVTTVQFPDFTGIQIMMMPFYLDDIDNSLPTSLNHYKPMLKQMVANKPSHIRYYDNNVAYLTIDEKPIKANQIQRKPGKHVDGMYKGQVAGAWGGGGGSWGSTGNGMLLVSNTDDLCQAWSGYFRGTPINDGDCSHLSDQCLPENRTLFKSGEVFWADGLCVHESLPTKVDVNRQFVRISMPSNSPWFVGYTSNPLGIQPNGPILNEKRI